MSTIASHPRKIQADSTEHSSQPSGPVNTGSVSVWERIYEVFSATHLNPLNVALHTITTPLCLFGLLAVVASFSVIAAVVAAVAYGLAVLPFVPKLVGLANTLAIAGLTMGVVEWQPGWILGVVFLAVGYVGQEVAHWITREKTLQSTYMGTSRWISELTLHTFFLLPLVLATSPRGNRIWFAPFVQRLAVIKTRLEQPEHQAALAAIRAWADREHPEITQSVHFWQNEMDGDAGSAFMKLSECENLLESLKQFHGPGYEAEPVYGMNELYVTGPVKKMTSDTVFYMPHVDGPWSVFPFATVYRCMVAASPNDRVRTHYPMMGVEYDPAPYHTLSTGDALSFDFNRELHYITRTEGTLPPCNRINLKLHFVTYPKWLRPYGRLLARMTTWYDIKARQLFLETIKPTTLWEKFKAFQVLASTRGFEWGTRFLGWTNLAYVTIIAVAAAALGSWTFFIAATSFIHYLIYLGTIEERGPISYGHFVRDAVFYKTLAMANLAGLMLAYFDPNPLSWALAAIGFGIAGWSAAVLGKARTYYGEELGFLEPLRIWKGPYKFLPHPMILGATIGLAGIWLNESLLQAFPWLIPVHVGFYALVLLQELTFRHRFQQSSVTAQQI